MQADEFKQLIRQSSQTEQFRKNDFILDRRQKKISVDTSDKFWLNHQQSIASENKEVVLKERGELQNTLSSAKGLQRIKIYKQIASTATRIKQQEWKDINMIRAEQEKNTKFKLKNLFYKPQIINSAFPLENNTNIQRVTQSRESNYAKMFILNQNTHQNIREYSKQRTRYTQNTKKRINQSDTEIKQSQSVVDIRQIMVDRALQSRQKVENYQATHQRNIKFQTQKTSQDEQKPIYKKAMSQRLKIDFIQGINVLQIDKNKQNQKKNTSEDQLNPLVLIQDQDQKPFDQKQTPSNQGSPVDQKLKIRKVQQKNPNKKVQMMMASIKQDVLDEDTICEKGAELMQRNFFLQQFTKIENRNSVIMKKQYKEVTQKLDNKVEDIMDYFYEKRNRNMLEKIGDNDLGKDAKFRNIRLLLKKTLNYLYKLRLHPKDLLSGEVFSTRPFQKPGSYELIQASKCGDELKVKELLIQNKYLVYDFDYVTMTALQWACKRGHYEIVKKLVQCGSDIDFQDMIGRTPLYFAIMSGNNDIVYYLLEHNVSPWSNPSINLNDACKEHNPDALAILSRSRKLYIYEILYYKKRDIQIKMSPLWKRQQILQNIKKTLKNFTLM